MVQPSNRLQAMMYLADELINSKKYLSIEDKIAIKHLLKKYTSVQEMQIIQQHYNKAEPIKNTIENVDDLTKVYRIASKACIKD